jgi:hypothetical protein
MTDAIREKGGEVLIFSSMHETGQRTLLDFSKSHVIHSRFRVKPIDRYRRYTDVSLGH